MAVVGTIVYTEETVGSMKKITCAWTSDASGNASGVSTTNAYNGALQRQVTVPGAAGAAPTNLYDLTLLDEDSTDVLMGAGADRSTSTTEQVLASSLGVVANDKLSITVANAGNAKSGTLYVYIR